MSRGPRIRITMQVKINEGLLDLLRDADKHMLKHVHDALAEAGKAWHRAYLPGHFLEGASRKYPHVYKARTQAYNQRKFRRFGHKNPMVWSGALRQVMMSAASTSKRKSGEGTAVVATTMRGTRAINLWGPMRKHDFRRALTAVTPTEWRKLGEGIERFVRRRVKEQADAGAMVPIGGVAATRGRVRRASPAARGAGGSGGESTQ